MKVRLLLAVAGWAALGASLYAQGGTAAIGGQVKDASGAVIPNATISVQNNDTNVVRTTQSNPDGFYSVPNLIPGNYTVTAQFQGMKNLERSGIVLRVGDRIALDLVMEVGAQSEHVTVSGETPLLRVEDVQSGLVIDNRRIQELPQYNRNALAFALLTPNVNNVTSQNEGHDADFRINGGRTAQAEYFIDGIPVTTGYLHNIPPSVPSMEAVGEFKVLTNGLSAEYGRLSGGAVTLVTRSGTNGFHGSAYEFFRNDKLNANDWSSNYFGRPKGVFHDNVFGFAVGGPVFVPKVYNGRDRTFFFLNYEGTRHSEGSNAVATGVPTDLERQGDFSQSLIDQGVPVQLFDPLTGKLTPDGRVVRDPFPGNRIPQSRFNPLSKIYMGFYPEPNTPPQPGSSHDQNYIGSTTNTSNDNRWTGRLDENWNASNSTHLSFIEYYSESTTPRWLSPMQAAGVGSQEAKTISLEHTWTVTPTLVFTARAGMVRYISLSGQSVNADSSNWGLQPLMINLLGTTKDRVPSIGTGDTIATLGGGSANDDHETDYTGVLSMQKLWGKHTLKFGYEHRRYYANTTSGGLVEMSTQRSITSQYFDTPTTGSGFASFLLGNAIWGDGTQLAGPASLQTYHGAYFQDDFKVSSKLTLNLGVRYDFEPPRTERFNRQIWWDKNYHWPVTPSPGWSWDLVQQAAGVTNAAKPDWLVNGYELGRVAVLGSKEYPGRVSQESYNTHFAPRVGVAWQFLPKTVLRAGYGINWLTTTGGQFLNGAPWNVGYGDFARFLQGGTPDNGLTFPLTFNNPMPNGVGYVPSPFVTRDVTAVNNSLVGNWFIANAWDQYPGYEHVVQFGIQREVGSGNKAWVVEGNFNANLGRDLPYWLGKGEHILPDAYHILGPYGATLNTPVPNPIYGQIAPTLGTGPQMLPFGRMYSREPFWFEVWTMGEPLGTSNYYAGYVQAEHRFGQGFGFLANYTFSKMLQDVGSIDYRYGQGPDQQAFPQSGLGFKDIYGIAPTDITHRFLFNYSWDVPVGKGRKLLSDPQGAGEKILNGIVGGWQLAGTTMFRTGQPVLIYTPSGGVGGLGSQWYNIGQSRTTRPVIVTPRQPFGSTTDGHAALQGSANFQYYLNPNAFRLPQGFEIGDVPSTFPNWRGPGYSQWDLSVLKDFALFSEQSKLQLRFEAQNLLNHMNAANPNGAVTQRTFGMITGQVGTPRRVMVAAKIYF
ncbi:MAG TPA: TonB-dependent receptor [Bryobacteraceae bacterium]|nr:TonB-dependent receptor [Bryobacteraceae bacterium]